MLGLVVGLASMVMAGELPRFDRLWNYDDPAGTEAKFREILPEAAGDAESGTPQRARWFIGKCGIFISAASDCIK